jgi:Asp-tRNA(Asn)/Glu-tRNA(Gln) amidotransferase A subunit family amidase
MKKSRWIRARLMAIGLLLITGLSDCAIRQKEPASYSYDHTFICYWSPAKESKRLRLAVKDLIDIKGVVTTAGSEYVAQTSPPATNDAACLAISRARNVQIVGKTNLSEFAVAPSGINDFFGTPRSPLSKNSKLIPGGSSSGSAAAVANGLADVAFGTDTAGSVRVPAACCGIVGLKTTFGLVSLKGVFPVEPKHLDTVGPMAKDVDHVVQGMDLLQNGFVTRYRAAVAAKSSAKNIRIGRLYLGGTDPKIDKAVDDALLRTQFEVVPLDQAFKEQWNQASKDGNTLAAAGAWISDGKYFDKLIGVSARTKAIIALGEFTFATNYQNALQRQAAWQEILAQTFKKVDFIALPTLQKLPPKIPLIGKTALLEMQIALFEAQMLGLQNTVAVNFAGNPALVIPIPLNDKIVPATSLQLVGPRLSEASLLNAGRLVEVHSGMIELNQ